MWRINPALASPSLRQDLHRRGMRPRVPLSGAAFEPQGLPFLGAGNM
jgi:hypothetical protein